MNPPRVFISYSHDSAEHKEWVLDFATTLRSRGVDIVLDLWELKPGDDLPQFMETQLETSDYVIMVCSKKYVEKANAGVGGVGYEKMILTSTLLSKIDSNKIIPIIRQKGSEKRPTFLKSKVYINFSNDADIEYSLDDLLRVLLNAPLYEKPEIGANQFKPLEGARPDRIADGVKEVMKAVAICYDFCEYDYIRFECLVKTVSMHRLTLDRYLEKTKEQGLINWDTHHTLVITQDGIDYLISHGIIED